jgi:glucose-6-phosphate dehydrogenase assembly protein OpcA
MITAEQIPEAVAHAAESTWSKDATWKEVVAAAFNAWPHHERRRWTVPFVTPSECDAIILPIMTPLGADFEKVWDDNAAELYED